jgi:L-2-hydroxyglutarate oxidase LhgO
VLERHPRPGLDTSTRNSGVIHGGIYYPAGSLKATLCVQGRELLYEFCARHRVPHERCGKLIVATGADEQPALERLFALGSANGVAGLRMVDQSFVAKREPAIRATAALYSPETGILDAEALVKALLRAAEAADAIFLPGTPLRGADSDGDAIVLHTERESIKSQQVVNAAGLYADEVSAVLGGEPFTIYPCRGEYAELVPAKRSLIQSLVYPLPHAHGLGVHFTKTMGGAVWMGPTARYQDRKDDYEDDRLPVESFLEPAQKIVPSIGPGDIRLSGSGIRAKLHPPSETFADFLIRRDTRNPAVVHAAGIESPGLTSCLAVGRMVADIVAAGQ